MVVKKRKKREKGNVNKPQAMDDEKPCRNPIAVAKITIESYSIGDEVEVLTKNCMGQPVWREGKVSSNDPFTEVKLLGSSRAQVVDDNDIRKVEPETWIWADDIDQHCCLWPNLFAFAALPIECFWSISECVVISFLLSNEVPIWIVSLVWLPAALFGQKFSDYCFYSSTQRMKKRIMLHPESYGHKYIRFAYICLLITAAILFLLGFLSVDFFSEQFELEDSYVFKTLWCIVMFGLADIFWDILMVMVKQLHKDHLEVSEWEEKEGPEDDFGSIGRILGYLIVVIPWKEITNLSYYFITLCIPMFLLLVYGVIAAVTTMRWYSLTAEQKLEQELAEQDSDASESSTDMVMNRYIFEEAIVGGNAKLLDRFEGHEAAYLSEPILVSAANFIMEEPEWVRLIYYVEWAFWLMNHVHSLFFVVLVARDAAEKEPGTDSYVYKVQIASMAFLLQQLVAFPVDWVIVNAYVKRIECIYLVIGGLWGFGVLTTLFITTEEMSVLFVLEVLCVVPSQVFIASTKAVFDRVAAMRKSDDFNVQDDVFIEQRKKNFVEDTSQILLAIFGGLLAYSVDNFVIIFLITGIHSMLVAVYSFHYFRTRNTPLATDHIIIPKPKKQVEQKKKKAKAEKISHDAKQLPLDFFGPKLYPHEGCHDLNEMLVGYRRLQGTWETSQKQLLTVIGSTVYISDFTGETWEITVDYPWFNFNGWLLNAHADEITWTKFSSTVTWTRPSYLYNNLQGEWFTSQDQLLTVIGDSVTEKATGETNQIRIENNTFKFGEWTLPMDSADIQWTQEDTVSTMKWGRTVSDAEYNDDDLDSDSDRGNILALQYMTSLDLLSCLHREESLRSKVYDLYDFAEFALTSTENLTESEFAQIDTAWSIMDTDGRGYITDSELLKNILFNDETIDLYINDSDSEEAFRIDRYEFMKSLLVEVEKCTEDEFVIIESHFREMDNDRDGRISHEEILEFGNKATLEVHGYRIGTYEVQSGGVSAMDGLSFEHAGDWTNLPEGRKVYIVDIFDYKDEQRVRGQLEDRRWITMFNYDSTIQETFVTMDPTFENHRLGDTLECEGGAYNWGVGIVTCLNPLEIKRNDCHISTQWDKKQAISVGQKLQLFPKLYSDQGREKWKTCTVVSINPLTLVEDETRLEVPLTIIQSSVKIDSLDESRDEKHANFTTSTRTLWTNSEQDMEAKAIKEQMAMLNNSEDINDDLRKMQVKNKESEI